MKKHYVIGVGGVGSWLAPALCLLVGKSNVVLVDGDRLERKNLNRQLFQEDEIGEYKSDALAKRLGCGQTINQFYSFGSVEHDRTDWLMCCVDNNPARLSVLRACDHYGCKAIFAANETTSAEAYLYLPRWKATQLDPRVYYPEINADDANDPRHPEGCTGEAQERTPQLVTANGMAAFLAQQLYLLWGMKASCITKETVSRMPYRHRANLSRMETDLINDKLNQPKERTENEHSNQCERGASLPATAAA